MQALRRRPTLRASFVGYRDRLLRMVLALLESACWTSLMRVVGSFVQPEREDDV